MVELRSTETQRETTHATNLMIRNNFLGVSQSGGSGVWSVMPIFPTRRLPHPGPSPEPAGIEQGRLVQTTGRHAMPHVISGLAQDEPRNATLRHTLLAYSNSLLAWWTRGGDAGERDTIAHPDHSAWVAHPMSLHSAI